MSDIEPGDKENERIFKAGDVQDIPLSAFFTTAAIRRCLLPRLNPELFCEKVQNNSGFYNGTGRNTRYRVLNFPVRAPKYIMSERTAPFKSII